MSKTKERIRESQLQYKHSLGQNFIYDEDLLENLALAAGIGPEDDVLEVGPGCGNLTKHLCAHAHHVLSVELDERLIPLLNAFMSSCGNFSLVQGDIMRLNIGEVTAKLRKPLSVVANIPYYITTPLINMLLTSGLEIRQMALMVQAEVARKIMAKPGQDGWGPLAVRCQIMCRPELALDVPAACFTPVPKVDSAFILLPFRKEPAVKVKNEKDLWRIVGAAFALRRKTMVNNLCATFRMERAAAQALCARAGVDEKARGETLTPEQLALLADALTEAEEEKA